MKEMPDYIPQLRVVMTTSCGKHCVYCRPSGEAACPVAKEQMLSTVDLLSCIRQLVQCGIREVRLTGGDPAFYPLDKLVWLVGELAKLGLYRLSLVTRSHLIRPVFSELKAAGLTHMTFSLDSMNADRWTKACGIDAKRRGEHQLLMDTIRAAKDVGLVVNLNSVLLNETCYLELPELVAFAKSLGIGLKIEEVIRDIGRNGADGESLHANLEPLKASLRKEAESVETVYVMGGLGHPMEVLHLQGGASVTWKMFRGGACYGPSCRSCDHFPCDDALMALRLLPNGCLQTCLKREDNLVDLWAAIGSGEGLPTVERALLEYRKAERLSYGEIVNARISRRLGRKVA